MLTKSLSNKLREVKIFVFLFVQKILDLIYFFNINIPSNKESEIIFLLKKYSFFHFHVAQLLKFVSSFYPLKVNTYKTDFCKGFFFILYENPSTSKNLFTQGVHIRCTAWKRNIFSETSNYRFEFKGFCIGRKTKSGERSYRIERQTNRCNYLQEFCLSSSVVSTVLLMRDRQREVGWRTGNKCFVASRVCVVYTKHVYTRWNEYPSSTEFA